MVRKLTVVIGVAMSLVVARDASPDTITPTNLDTWTGDRFFLRSHTDSFRVPHPPFVVGELTTSVFFDGSGEYTYVLRVTPGFADSFNSLPREPGFSTLFGNTEDPFFRNEFGFTGVMGWSFSDADAAGFFFDGDAGDFLVGESVFTGQLGWAPSPRWPPFAPISFFLSPPCLPGWTRRLTGWSSLI